MTAHATAVADSVKELAFVAAILAAAAFAGLLTWINNPIPESRFRGYAAESSAIASVFLLISVVGWAMLSSDIIASGEVRAIASPLHFWLSLSFLAGIAFFMISVGVSGWVFSKRLGIISTIVAVLGSVALVLVLAPFVGFG